MFELLLLMLERLGLIVMLAFIATRFRFFRKMASSIELSIKQKTTAILFFGVFGIIGTYSGVTFQPESLALERFTFAIPDDAAIANFRVIGVMLAGLFGGMKVGLGAGLIAGIHRMMLGGFTAVACGVASILAGVLAAYYRNKNPQVIYQPLHIMILGALAEAMQMGLIAILATPTTRAIELVQLIGIPMIIANGIGCVLFFLIIQSVSKEEQKAGALQAQKSLRIAEQTLVYLKHGLSNQSAFNVCTILYKELNACAVAMTDRSLILSHIGVGADHHKANMVIQTQLTSEVMKQKRMIIASDDEIHCKESQCPLGAAVIAPLIIRDNVVGTLKFYYHSKKDITALETEMLSGLTKLLSSQLELAEADRAYQLAKDAEVNALQAQISPHFLFNTLNTVISLIRLDPKKARTMLHSLSQFLRHNVSATTVTFHSLKEELQHIQAYLSIEEVRFEDRLSVTYTIEEELQAVSIPPLTLQPLVENAVKHGFRNKRFNCELTIHVFHHGDKVGLRVRDNGEGFDESMLNLNERGQKTDSSTGIGIYNSSKRLQMMFGESASLRFSTELGKGTTVECYIPKSTRKETVE
ncbi:LytS/YhcK type 5TM receptor domain-containing protein [Shouchella miscanthi]|uniref:histidine kinase n=1 Tax=Shouchella miscanthi TaxID=2598861 RepID=A0ABU6NFG9_9BACI|nr:LytS/YhcK type 5TM receptor domain-containing protein [Shouchella miscanthi]MED4126766.1 LytS/YhcK type 5TM receptor domain-containing protein [Shouchella miscanthi]